MSSTVVKFAIQRVIGRLFTLSIQSTTIVARVMSDPGTIVLGHVFSAMILLIGGVHLRNYSQYRGIVKGVLK